MARTCIRIVSALMLGLPTSSGVRYASRLCCQSELVRSVLSPSDTHAPRCHMSSATTGSMEPSGGHSCGNEHTAMSSEYHPTSTAAVQKLCGRRERDLSHLSNRWHRMRIAWLVTGSTDITTVPRTGDNLLSDPMLDARARDADGRVDAGDLSDGEIDVLLGQLDELKRQKRKRRVRVNVASIKRVLRDPERNENLTFTRPLPLPQMVEVLSEHWDEEGAAA